MIYSSLITGAILVVAGLLIWYFKFTLGFGGKAGQKVDKVGLSSWIGKCLIIAGASVAIIDNAIYLIFHQYFYYISMALVLIISFWMTTGTNKFIKGPAVTAQKADPRRLARKQAAGKTPEALKHNKKKAGKK